MNKFHLVAATLGVLLAGASHVVSAQSSCSVGQTSRTFSFTGVEQTTVIPAGMSSANVFINGAQGGAGGGPLAGAGGLGGRVSGTLTLTPGQTLSIFVGGQGSVFNGSAIGGNAGGGIGGGASDVRVGGNAVINRVAVAGGGGGGGSTGCDAPAQGGLGGTGGGGAGAAGANAPTSGGSAGGGAGGTSGAGGAAGIGCGGFLGTAGQANGTGGAGQACCCFGSPRIPGGGGGGGGATVGGGGGGGSAGTAGCSGNDKGAGGGGGGGTSTATGLTASTITNGAQTGDGFVEVCLVPTAVVVNSPTSIPTLSTWAMLLMAALMLAIGFGRSRRS